MNCSNIRSAIDVEMYLTAQAVSQAKPGLTRSSEANSLLVDVIVMPSYER
jgi:hypothetical protein